METLLVTENELPRVRAFLERHVDSSLFLLGNLADHGLGLGPSMNSGNFKMIEESGQIVAVFCLTRRGNLLVQTGGRRDLHEPILAACAAETHPLKGVVGEFQGADSIWQELRKGTNFQPGFASKEPLYSRALDAELPARSQHVVRRVGLDDFARWDELMHAFLAEEGLPMQGTLEERRDGFRFMLEAGRGWVALDGADLVATATLNARVGSAGQLGGVFTVPERRRRGFSRAVLVELMHDTRARLGLTRLALFTGERSTPARTLYESLGFCQVGEFALFFAAEPEKTP
jgi:predicted GNAT family acetyltransferase